MVPMTTISLAHLVSEQRALRTAELAFDRAEQAFVASIVPSVGCKSWAARVRYYEATTDLHSAVARLEKRKCELAGIRHLRVASQVVR